MTVLAAALVVAGCLTVVNGWARSDGTEGGVGPEMPNTTGSDNFATTPPSATPPATLMPVAPPPSTQPSSVTPGTTDSRGSGASRTVTAQTYSKSELPAQTAPMPADNATPISDGRVIDSRVTLPVDGGRGGRINEYSDDGRQWWLGLLLSPLGLVAFAGLITAIITFGRLGLVWRESRRPYLGSTKSESL
jgi:hypothetical protein